MAKKNYITGLDIGTTKVCVIIGEYNEESGALNIVGMGTSPNYGMKQGAVIDVAETAQAIHEAVSKAEEGLRYHVREVYVGVAGAHITSQNLLGNWNVANPMRGVTEKDRNEALARALNSISIPNNQQLLMKIPQDFILDNHPGVSNPVDMYANIISARVHAVFADRASLGNIRRAIHNVGLVVKEVILESVASSLALLTEEQKEAGVALIDMGGGTSDVAVFTQGQIRSSYEIPYAGDSITKDLVEVLRISYEAAEILKKKHACALSNLVDSSSMVTITDLVTDERRQVQRYLISQIVESRLEQIFKLSQEAIEKTDVKPVGIVLTGGTALMPGMRELAARVFQPDSRAGKFGVLIGVPTGLTGLAAPVQSPIYSTCVGLVWYGALYPNGIGESAPTEDSVWRQFVEKFRIILTQW